MELSGWKEGGDPDSLIAKAMEARDNTSNRQFGAAELDKVKKIGSNTEYEAFEMFEHYKGKKVFNTYAQVKDSQNNMSWQLIRSEGLKTNWFPIIDRSEDKQRVLAILTNLGLEAVVRELYPRFTFNKDKISGVALNNPKQIGFPVEGDPNYADV